MILANGEALDLVRGNCVASESGFVVNTRDGQLTSRCRNTKCRTFQSGRPAILPVRVWT